MRPLDVLLAALADAEGAEGQRDSRIRAEFERRTGHPRGVAVYGADGAVWWELQGADPPDHAAADALVDDAVTAYLDADEDGRAALQAAFENARYLRGRARWLAGAARGEMVASSGDSGVPHRWLRRALAAIVLEGGITDYRDTIVSLDGLYVAALQAGIDPAPLFAEAAPAATSSAAERHRAAHLLAMYAAPDRAAALAKAAASRRADASERPPSR